jgi:hypothetical protein
MNPEKSTLAAIKYLKTGYDSNKTWTLSAAGYNMGHSGVADNLNFQAKSNFYDMYLNEETSRYILRIVIIKEIMSNAEKYGFIVKDEDKYGSDDCEAVECYSAIPDLSAWAIEHGTDYKAVKLNNPWILKRKLPAPAKGGSYSILIPKK